MIDLHDLRKEITALLDSLSLLSEVGGRQALLLRSGLDEILQQIDCAGKPFVFVSQLFNTLYQFGNLQRGQHALDALLEGLKGFCGTDKQAAIEDLRERLRLHLAESGKHNDVMAGAHESVSRTEPEERARKSGMVLEEFEFDVIAVDKSGDVIKQDGKNVRHEKAYQYIEELEQNVTLEMVAILEGKFLMGAISSSEDEPGWRKQELPQRNVVILPFYMGKHPVTQVQWKTVAEKFPRIVRELNPDPSAKAGKDLPVEQISWHDAQEFCARLRRKTGRPYRLPSEAEWEYACRAGTTTPFHFGETLTSELANYDCTGTYRNEPAKEENFRGRTMFVRSFSHANNFGLYGMHGNVFEWCCDLWHDDYRDAPDDGSAWISNPSSSERVIRGGSWIREAKDCRSAYRYWHSEDKGWDEIGFRVACDLLV